MDNPEYLCACRCRRDPMQLSVSHGMISEWDDLALLPRHDSIARPTNISSPCLGNRGAPNYGGELLSRTSGVGYDLWTRGHSADYDAWAELVGDDRWSYNRILQYFKKTEHQYDPKSNREQHGFDGPISTTAAARKYPLQEPVFNVLINTGIKFNPDGNAGSPLDLSTFAENWIAGEGAHRQPAGQVYDFEAGLRDEAKTATGVVLVDGRLISPSKEVIVSCGSFKTPQLLMLSGIGPAPHLVSHGIQTLVSLPVALIGRGNSFEWVTTSTILEAELAKVVAANKLHPNDPYAHEPRGHIETTVTYAPIAGGGSHFKLQIDGTHISTPVVLLISTSRGTIMLASTDPNVDPIIDPHYLETEGDKQVMRSGLPLAMRTMETEDGDEHIDKRLAIVGCSFSRMRGRQSMGTVVDTKCRVMGVKNLRACKFREGVGKVEI
ncbi:GMC oxidoreductase [Lepidopterella palustris CBS 459.81]|uniref:GMC oxidoreductase n=1 Tax=Lepidopterella palustris CBS 459.81 TaxID=1314670 RepID=A0A8E2E285_9PEZI|nr:GMC oxidoreductase [Lepidopterella palustris CBS 459.81]